MKLYTQLFFILLFSFIGEAVSRILPFPVPGSIIGLLALFAALQFGWIKLEQVSDVGNFLTDNLAILFLPAGVGVIVFFPVIAENWGSLLAIILVSTILTLGFTAWLVQSLVKVFGTEGTPAESVDHEEAR